MGELEQVEAMKLGIQENPGTVSQGMQQNEAAPWWVYFVGFFLPIPLDRLLRLPFTLTRKSAVQEPTDDKKEAT